MQPNSERQQSADIPRPPLQPQTDLTPSAQSAARREGREVSRLDPVPPYVFTHPALLSDATLFSPSHGHIRRYVFDWIRHPDEGSAFDKATRLVRWLPDRALFGLLRMFNYDGLIFTRPEGVVAHVFFQKHGTALHMFSVSVVEALRGQGLAQRALDRFVEHARSVPGIERVRLGAGGHPAVRAVCDNLSERQNERQVVPEGNSFFRFRR